MARCLATLYTAGSVSGHCMAGRHRSLLGVGHVVWGGQALEGKMRQVQIYKVLPQNTVGDWIRQVRRNATTGVVWPPHQIFLGG